MKEVKESLYCRCGYIKIYNQATKSWECIVKYLLPARNHD